MLARFSSPREASRQQANVGDPDPGLSAGDGGLEVLSEATVAPEPSEGALDHPSLRLGFERSYALVAGDDLDRPLAQISKRVEELWPAIDPIGKDVAQLGEPSPERSQQRHGAMIVLDVGRVDQQGEQQALRVGDDVTFAALHPLGCIKPAWAAAFRRFYTLA